MPSLIFLTILFALSALTARTQSIDYRGFPEWSWGKKDSTEYFLYQPSKIHPGRKYPLMLFLHGCCGEDYHATLRNAVDPPVRVWHGFGENKQVEPTLILAPKTKVGWQQHINNLKSVIDELVAQGVVDKQRIYISGFSMGAAGTWEFIEAHPEYFAAAIPMGMDFKGKDLIKFKDIPIWTIRGEDDWWARHLGSQIEDIRKFNHPESDSTDFSSGVNPRLTTFKDVGHGVMWRAVSELDLVAWTYSKINDGNRYPTMLITSPTPDAVFRENEKVTINIDATDQDGTIGKVQVYVNGKLLRTIIKPPFTTTFQASAGDSFIEVIATDEKGKSTEASRRIKVNVPTHIYNPRIDASAGKYIRHMIKSSGNGDLRFCTSRSSTLPLGIRLTTDGLLEGVPSKPGDHSFEIDVIDEDGDSTRSKIYLHVSGKVEDAVLTNARDYKGKDLPLGIVQAGLPAHQREDDEVTFSGTLKPYAGDVIIRTAPLDTVHASPHYLSFETLHDVTVFVAYEKIQKPKPSTIPEWLKSFKKEKDNLILQYYYYDVYSRDYPKGHITLPDAEEQRHGVNTNYFVIVRKKKK